MFKILSYNKSIIKNNIRLHSYIGIIWSIILFLILPFRMFRWIADHGSVVQDMFNINFNNGVHLPMGYIVKDTFAFGNVFLYIIPVAIGIVFVRYLHSDKPTTFYHSLPVTRIQMLNSQIISGFLLFTVPLILNLILTFLVFLPYGAFYKEFASLLFIYLGLGSIAIFTMVYLITIATGLLVGTSLLQAALVYVFILLPFYLTGTISYMASQLLYGYHLNDSIMNLVIHYTPLTFIQNTFGFVDTPYSIDTYIISTIYTVLSFLVAHLLYKYRNLENNNQFIVFNKFKVIFVTVLSTCSVLFFGLIIYELTNKSFMGLLIGSVIGAIIGHWVTTMISRKTIFVLRYYKSLIATILITLFVILGLNFDIFGYQNYVPSLDEISSVEYSESLYNNGEASLQIKQEMNNTFPTKEDFHSSHNPTRYLYKEKSSIEAIANYHKAIINSKDEENMAYETAKIVYHLKNGKKITRAYTKICKEKTKEEFLDLVTSKEYIYNNNMLLWDLPFEITQITLYSEYVSETSMKQKITIADKQKIKELVDIMKKSAYEDKNSWVPFQGLYYYTNLYKVNVMANFETDLMYNRYWYRDEHFREYKKYDENSLENDLIPYDFDLVFSFNNPTIIKWLKDNEYYNKLFIDPSDVKEAIIVNSTYETIDSIVYDDYEDKYGKKLILSNENIISDPKTIKELIDYLHDGDVNIALNEYKDKRDRYSDSSDNSFALGLKLKPTTNMSIEKTESYTYIVLNDINNLPEILKPYILKINE